MSNKEKINKIKEILKRADGIADSQEFGLSYGQAINYLEEIKDIIKGQSYEQEVTIYGKKERKQLCC